jgi:hypothetical protein
MLQGREHNKTWNSVSHGIVSLFRKWDPKMGMGKQVIVFYLLYSRKVKQYECTCLETMFIFLFQFSKSIIQIK